MKKIIDLERTALQPEPGSTTERGATLARLRARRRPELEKGESEAFFARVTHHLDALDVFTRHALAFAEARGDLTPGRVTAEDLLDSALLRAEEELAAHAGLGKVDRISESWLMRAAWKQLEREITRDQTERRTNVSLESGVPRTPPEEWVSTLGDEIFDFFQPDSALRLEDVVADVGVPTPEDAVEHVEMRSCVNRAVAQMPREWRRLLTLTYLENVPRKALPAATGMAEAEVDRALAYARSYLKERLLRCVLPSESEGAGPDGAAARRSAEAARPTPSHHRGP